MNAPNGAALLPLAESIADGALVDWDAVEAAASQHNQAVIRQLRVLSSLAGLHRSLPSEPGAAPAALLAQRAGAAPAIGNWAHLTLIERLGGGTFGEVYRAWDRHLEREVALKLLRADESIDDLRASRIAMEGRLLARVRHANVITVHGVDAHDGRVGLWMELVRGVTLEQQVAARGALSAREAAAVGIDLCRALAAIHAAGLIHRDVKAQNVMREDGGRIVLMDLGTGREVQPSGGRAVPDLAGTPLYLAPEIFSGAPASERTDLYSLGVLLYHLVTGAFPVRATTIEDLREGHAKGAGVRLRDARADLPTAFVRVVDRAIAADPSRRYESAGALEADLVQALDAATTPAAPVGAGTEPRVPWLTWPRAGILVTTLAAMLALAAVGWPTLRGRRAPAATPAAIHSIAVLPLANLSGDPQQEYFADGMTDQLIGSLGHLGGVTVISRTSAMQFKGSTKPLSQIARELHVDAVLEGSVLMLPGQRAGDTDGTKRVRITARLIYAGSETQLWDRTFETVVADVFGLQNDVARAVADGIHVRLTPTAAGRTGQDFEAFDLYLKGRYNWNMRTKDGLNESVRLFQQALARDPRSAAAYAGLADAYTMLATYGWLPYADGIARARQAALKALDLDDTLAEAHASLGLVHDNRLEWDAADASYKRALDLNPGYAPAHHWYASHLAQRGYFEDAVAEIRKATVLDPLSAAVQGELGIILFLSRRFDEAIVQSEKTLQMNATLVRPNALMAEAYAQQHNFNLAFAAADRAAALDPAGAELLTYRARILALAGRREEALRIATEVGERFRTVRDVHAVDIAAIYASLPDNDRAFEWLERARQARDPWIPYVKVDPWFDKLRTDRRFDSLLASLGLTQ